MKRILGIALIMTFLVSCGSDDDDNGGSARTPAPQPEEQTEGVFRGVLHSLNPEVSSAVAPAQVRIEGDLFEVEMFPGSLGEAQHAQHAQHIHAGKRCPTEADDTNSDGVIDSVEAAEVYGEVVVPLDSDLSSDEGTFQTENSYVYRESASLSQMLSNLGLDTLDPEGLVMDIHGVPESTELPPTVQGNKADFPVACGTLLRVEN